MKYKITLTLDKKLVYRAKLKYGRGNFSKNVCRLLEKDLTVVIKKEVKKKTTKKKITKKKTIKKKSIKKKKR